MTYPFNSNISSSSLGNLDPNDIPAVVEIYSKAAGKWFVGLVVKQDGGWIAGNAVGMGRLLAYWGRFYDFKWGKSEKPSYTSYDFGCRLDRRVV